MATFEPGSALSFEPRCLPVALGSLPLTDPQEACELVLEHFPQLPMWPQLPRRSFLENMYVQYSQGLPGVIVGPDSIRVDRENVEEGLEKLYIAYLDNRPADVAISPAYAAGLAALLAMPGRVSGALAVKGHLTGPISLGLQITDLDRRPILYDEILADAVAKLLRLKATWQEQTLRRLNPQTIIFVDEPYLSTFGSAHVPITRDQVLIALEEVLAGIQGLKGLHCCGNTDWSMLLETSMNIISFDAYHYSVPFSLYAGEISGFLARGGMIAWGMIPNDPALLEQETVESLVDRLLAAMDLLVQKGLARDDLLQRALISASCGLGTLPVAAAVRACQLTAGVSALLRARYLSRS